MRKPDGAQPGPAGIGNFIRAVRTKNLYSATSVDQLPHMVAAHMMFGHQFLMPVPDVDRTQLFVCIGGNPVASGGSLMSAPGFEKRVEALRARGGRFIVIDPRRTESAAIADRPAIRLEPMSSCCSYAAGIFTVVSRTSVISCSRDGFERLRGSLGSIRNARRRTGIAQDGSFASRARSPRNRAHSSTAAWAPARRSSAGSPSG
jgi:hypothetical protein